MPLSQADRISFSLNIVSAPAQAAQIDANKAVVQKQADVVQSLDTANANLMTAPNAIINLNQPELGFLAGTRTTVVEQDLQDSANKVLNNHFFPNNTTVIVPSLSGKNNVWPNYAPFALTYAIGKNATESYDNLANAETSLITTILGYSTTTAPSTIIAKVNTYVATANSEFAAVPTTDTNPTHSANNIAAKNQITTQLLPALNAYLSASHPATPAPPATQPPDPAVTALQAALTIRQTFVNTRIAQINAILGSITQDVSTGAITSSSGAYGQRYAAISLRLNVLSGTLAQLANFKVGIAAQTALKSSLLQNTATYAQFVPTSILKSDANNLTTIHVANPSLFAPGDTVYVYAEGQTELLRGIASINNDVVVLNDIVPSKYTVATYARIYKDLT